MIPILEIQNISKKFRIHHAGQPYLNFRDSVSSIFKKSRESNEDFWALKNITFDVQAGESLGIIGRNGAGKSTLLKILSKITPPSAGQIISRGRIASLLEVGTGFHPELTGKENIFLNGSIIGMKRNEIIKKFDEIIDFSGVEMFLDTPLKHYSSGMQLRLAFAVAAFLEPEILVIDEVLAVGDSEFQKKCIGKMDEVSKSGRTILFVSHNLGAVKTLCTKAVFLHEGTIAEYGNCEDVINRYMNSGSTVASKIVFENKSSKWLNIHSIELINSVENNFAIKFDEPIKLKICFNAKQKINDFSVGIGVTSFDYVPLFTIRSGHQGVTLKPGDEITAIVDINHNLRAGQYNMALGIAQGNFSFYYNFNIAQLEILNYGQEPYHEMDIGLMNCKSDWNIKYND
jgi:ABC-type polysaccharide/polyol phosphate transport system ATPase subunit